VPIFEYWDEDVTTTIGILKQLFSERRSGCVTCDNPMVTANFENTMLSSFFLERFQSKALRMIADAPWYVPNTVIRRNFHTPTVKEEIRRYSSQYRARISAHPNDLIVNHLELRDNRRLRRYLPNYLSTTFQV
jgi:hypothetical protein